MHDAFPGVDLFTHIFHMSESIFCFRQGFLVVVFISTEHHSVPPQHVSRRRSQVQWSVPGPKVHRFDESTFASCPLLFVEPLPVLRLHAEGRLPVPRGLFPCRKFCPRSTVLAQQSEYPGWKSYERFGYLYQQKPCSSQRAEVTSLT